VVEGALRCADLGEQVLDAEVLVAACLDEQLTGVDELVAPRRMPVRVDRSWCRIPSGLGVGELTNRPSV